METGEIPAEDMEASSTKFPGDTDPWVGRLNNPLSAWSPKLSDQQPYLDVDLGSVKRVTAVSTQGHPLAEEYVRQYHLKYSYDGERYYPVTNRGGHIKVS